MTAPALYKSHALGPLYVVTERFNAGCGDRWRSYIAWSGLGQVAEIVSLDPMLCPSVLRDVVADDWPHIVNENFMTGYFLDLDYLLRRAGSYKDRNLLCVFRNPESRPQPPAAAMRFEFLGFDLVDVTGAASAITNCGGFPDVFSNDELNSFGLLDSLERAREVQHTLCAKYPGNGHTETHVWAVLRARA
jgi:hypothetical protein